MDLNKPGELREYVGDAREAVIPEGVKWICDHEFRGLENLEQVTLPSTLEAIGRRAFHDCRNLQRVYIPGSVEWIGDYAFSRCRRLEEVAVAEGVRSIGQGCFQFCFLLKDVVLPESLEVLGSDAFYQCYGLERAVIHGRIESVGCGTFHGCTVLKEVSLPASVKKIDSRAFTECENVAVELPYSLFQTRSALDPTLCKYLPRDVEVLAYVLAFQARKEWLQALTRKSKGCEGAVLTCTLELLGNEKRVDVKTATRIVEFGLSKWQSLDREQFLALHELVTRGNKRKTKAALTLEDDPRVSAYFVSDGVDTVSKANDSLVEVESIVSKRMVWDDVSLKVRKKLKKGVKLAGSDAVSSPDVLNYLISEYARITPGRVHITVEPGNPHVNIEGFGDYRKAYWIGACYCPEADEVAKSLDQRALSDALGELVGESLWESRSFVPEALTAYARYADEVHVSKLVTYINKWTRGKVGLRRGAVIARGALMLNDTKAAMLYLDSIGALPAYARLRGVDPNVLRDTRLADFGLDEDGRKVYELGDKTVTVSLLDDLTLQLVNDATGKVVRSIPKRGSDPELYETARTDFAAMRKNVKKAIAGRTDKLLVDFLSGRETKAEEWASVYLGNPVLRSIARLLVWQQGKQTFTIRGKETVDAAGQPVVLDKVGIVLAHPMYMEVADVVAWQQYLLTERLRQPFKQMWESVVNLNAIESDRYSYIKIRAYLLRNKDKHGIHVRLDGYYDYDVQFDDCRATVAYINSERHAVSQDDYCVIRNIAIRKHSRMSNHIIAYLDRCALYAGAYTYIDDDDVAAFEPLLEQLDLAKTIDLLQLASERGATKVAARLLDYKEHRFPEAAEVESLEL